MTIRVGFKTYLNNEVGITTYKFDNYKSWVPTPERYNYIEKYLINNLVIKANL